MSDDSNVHKLHRERVRARFDREGLEGFHDHEALELLLFYANWQGDMNPVAHRLMQRFGSFHRVLEATPEQLMEVNGVGEQSARLICLVAALHRRYCQDGVRYRASGHALDSTEKMAHFLMPALAALREEATVVACVDAKLRPICCDCISRGTARTNDVLSRRIAELAMLNNAPAVIVAHNHPRGHAGPSPEDIRTTQQLYKLLAGLDVELIDHIVIGDGEYASLRDYGVFDRRP